MKVCVIASTYPRFSGDGSGRFVQSLSEAVANQGHEVHLLAPYHPTVGHYESPVQRHYFRYVYPDSLSIMGYAEAMESDKALRPQAYGLAPLYALAEFYMLQRLTLRHRFDVFHVHWVIPNAPVATVISNAARIPLVITLHGSDIFMARKHGFLHRPAEYAFRSAQAVSACSPDLREGALQLGASEDKVHLIPWGADPALFASIQDAESIATLRKRLNLSDNQPVILSLGRLVRKKGIHVLVRAMSTVAEAHPNVRCLVAGTGPELASLQMLVQEFELQKYISFVGNVEWTDVPLYLALADIFTVPSARDENGNSDQLPTTILEAMAAAKPVVASRLAGIPMVVAHEETGLLVDEQSPQQLATALIRLLNCCAERKRMGEVAQQRVRQELNWHAIARQFVHLYQQGVPHVQ